MPRQAHRRAERDGASFEVLAPGQVIELLPTLEKISNSWLASKSTGEKRFSVGAFSAEYLRNFPMALVRSELGEASAAALAAALAQLDDPRGERA